MKKKKYRYLAEAHFDPELGNSYAIINTELGQFLGSAQCSSEDFAYCSKFFGCGLAEMRANLKYWKLRRIRAKAALAAIKETIIASHGTSNSFIWDIEAKYKKEVKTCNEAIDLLSKEINDSISEREKAMRLDKRRKEKLNKN